MKQYLKLAIISLLSLTALHALADVEWSCVNNCTSSGYMYDYCTRACSY